MRELADYVEGLVEGRRGMLIQEKRERRVWHVQDATGRWFAKLGIGAKRREIRREARNARLLEEMGLGPEVLAAGDRDGGSWVVTADATVTATPAVVSLLQGGPSELDRLARGIRRFHDGGLSFPDLTDQHVFVDRDQDRILLIDAARLERHRGPTPAAARARDVAALLFSIEFRWGLRPHRARRFRLTRATCGHAGPVLRRFLQAVDVEFARLASRTRWRHRHWRVRDRSVLRDLGADVERAEFERLTDPARWGLVRALPDRKNLRFPASGRARYFAKRYPSCGAARSPALRELESIERFDRAGILVHRVVAYADDLERGSLLAVHACRGLPLDDLLRRGVTVAERRALAVQTARIWRRMRECGLRHRDAYPCHLFVAPWEFPDGTGGATLAGSPRFELRLIDLTRAGLAPFPKERWFVKDAAQLWHGCPKPPVTRTDAVRWLREYFRVPKLTRAAKRFARKVAAKERSIAAHVARKARRARDSP